MPDPGPATAPTADLDPMPFVTRQRQLTSFNGAPGPSGRSSRNRAIGGTVQTRKKTIE
jgi:hypothetical protein